MTARPRLTWFDANRVCAAMGVVLIHSTADFSGQAFPKADVAERIGPVMLRSLAEFSGSEMFFFFSLFLMAMRIDRGRPTYGSAMALQAERLLVPFAFWTVFYAFFRMAKADVFHYLPGYIEQLSMWQTWVKFFLLGTGQYHLHFLPTLFLLFLFYPVMRLAMRYPILGLSLFATLGAMDSAQGFLWSQPIDPMLRDFLLRGLKVMGYVGYGLAAFAIYGLWKDGIPRGESKLIGRGSMYFAAMAFLATLPFFGAAIATGTWGVRTGSSFYGHFLMPVFMFGLFMGAQYGNWSPIWTKLAQYTFGVYLVHPILIDLYDIVIYSSGLSDSLRPLAIVSLRYAFALPGALLLAIGISKLKLTAWTVGLGPAPWTWSSQSPKQQG